MREILFRGKRIDNGEWVYGDLRQYSEKSKGIYDYKLKHTVKVIPETIGQYTGLTANGTKIFEGDIAKGKSIFHDYEEILICVFGDGGFWFRGQKSGNDYCLDNLIDPVIVGNIHDNSELLKGE